MAEGLRPPASRQAAAAALHVTDCSDDSGDEDPACDIIAGNCCAAATISDRTDTKADSFGKKMSDAPQAGEGVRGTTSPPVMDWPSAGTLTEPNGYPPYSSSGSRHGVPPAVYGELSLNEIGARAWLTENNLMYAGAAVVVALSCADLSLRFLAPCPFRDVSVDPTCRARQVEIHWVGVAKYVVGVSPFLVVVLLKCLRILRLQQDKPWFPWLSWLPWAKGPLPSNHWNIVATRSFYESSVHSVKMLHLLVVLVQIPSLVFNIQQVAEGVMLYTSGYESAPDCQMESTAGQAESGGGFNSLHCQGRIWRFLAIQAAWEVCIVPFSILIVTPDMMWAPGVQTAAALYKDRAMQRLAVLPWVLLPSASLLTLNTFLFWCVLWDEVAEGTGTVVAVHFIICIVCFCLGLAVLVWSRIVHDSVALLSKGIRTMRKTNYDNLEEQPAEQQSLTWDLTRRDYRKVMAVQVIYLFVSYAGSWVVNIIIFSVLRGIVLALLFLASERECSFTELQNGDPALGLLMGAEELCRALTASESGKLWKGHIPSYLGTVVRMQTTLAVSYKWCEEERQISNKKFLNMSSCQIQALVKAIKATRCDYVWVDRLAVPQQQCGLQNTLLSRMLIVYASSQATLAIRTQESTEELRYHRRAWTLQEFCSARHLYAETEELEPGELALKSAVTPEEAKFFNMLRSSLQASLCSCQPLWLCDLEEYITPEKAKRIVELYTTLAPLLYCENAGDKLRALCPLLATVTVEGHRELRLLIDCVKERAGVDHLDSPGENQLQSLAAKSWKASLSRMSTRTEQNKGVMHTLIRRLRTVLRRGQVLPSGC